MQRDAALHTQSKKTLSLPSLTLTAPFIVAVLLGASSVCNCTGYTITVLPDSDKKPDLISLQLSTELLARLLPARGDNRRRRPHHLGIISLFGYLQ